MNSLDEIILRYWPLIMVFLSIVIWGARLESRLKHTVTANAEVRRRQEKLEERIAKDLDGIKADSASIKAALEGIQGYMQATREYQQRAERS